MGKVVDFTFLKELEESKRILINNKFDLFDNNFKRINDINTQPLNLAIMGECSAGKSTFINKLINNNQEILPTGFIPITSTITKLCYGKDEKIEIIKVNNNTIETKEHIGYDKLESYQRASDSDDLIVTEELKKIKEIKVFVDNPLLKLFYIIDTPGFNQNDNISEITKNIFNSVDFIIWLTKGSTISQSEIVILEELKKYDKDIYCINNFADQLEDDESKISFQKDLKNKYNHIFINHENPYFISCNPNKNNDEVWNKKFQELIVDLQTTILSKDIDLSKKLIKKEYFILKDNIDSAIFNNENLKNDITNILSDKKNIMQDSEYLEKLELFIIELSSGIQEKLNKTKDRLVKSKAYKQDVPSSVLEFYSQLITYETMEKLEKDLKGSYEQYMVKVSQNLIITLNKLKQLFSNNTNLLLENKQNIIIKIDNLILLAGSSLVSGNKLLIIGGLLGVLSNNFLFKTINELKNNQKVNNMKNTNNSKSNFFRIIKNMTNHTEEISLLNNSTKKDIVASLTIKELLERDFDINYYIDMIDDLHQNAIEIINTQIKVLENSQRELREIKKEEKK